MGILILTTESSPPSVEPLLQRHITDKELKAIGDLHLAVEEGDLSTVSQCLESGFLFRSAFSVFASVLRIDAACFRGLSLLVVGLMIL